MPNGGLKAFAHSKNSQVKFVLDHTMPFIYTLIDWFLNSIGAQWSHILPNMLVMLAYAIVNCVYCTVTGDDIYPVLTWDSTQAWLVALGLIPAFIILQALLIWCTNFKLSKINKEKWETEVKVEDLEAETAAAFMNDD